MSGIAQLGFGALARDSNYAMNLALLADTCTLLRDSERAGELYRILLPYEPLYVHFAHATTYGAVARHLGNMAAVMHHFDSAVRHFDAALAMDRRLGARAWEARTQIDYARMRLDRDDPGDREQARALLGAALATSQELGLKAWLDMALALKLRAQGTPSGEWQRSIDVVAASVEARRPDMQAHASTEGHVTLMFSDMEGFTTMTERLGDREAYKVIQDHHRIVREQLAAHGGHELELQGDGFLLAFATPISGLRCADRHPARLRRIQRRASRAADPRAHRPAHGRSDQRPRQVLRPHRHPRRPHRGTGDRRRNPRLGGAEGRHAEREHAAFQ